MKGQVDENTTKLAKLDVGNNSNEYKVEVNDDNAAYAKKLANHLLGLYYLVFLKDYLEKENI